jgi:hypothetical protein
VTSGGIAVSSGIGLTESIEHSVPRPRAAADPAVSVAVRPSSRRWQRRLTRIVVATDLTVIALVSALATIIGDWGLGPSTQFNAVAAALVLAGLVGHRAWDRGVLGQGADEFNRVLRGTAAAAVLLALAGMALKVEQVRPWIFGVIPATGAGLLLGRYAVRRVLHRARRDAWWP